MAMLNKKKIKEQLEKERDLLVGELSSIGRLNEKTGDWEAVPEEQGWTESDQNDRADRYEEFETRGSTLDVLESRLEKVNSALENLSKKSFGTCEVCKKKISAKRIEANPAATTCKEHLN